MRGKYYAFLIILIAVLISLFFPWELQGEAWFYWFWARVFKETGRFIMLDRSPLYTLYLSLFIWMPYPFSVIVEHIVTSLIGMVSMTALFKQYVKLPWAVFASLIWLPFLQTADPPVQFLGLSCTSVAMVIRITKKGRFWNALFYTFLTMAYLFRTSYLILILTFIIWDVYLLFRRERGNWNMLTTTLKPKIGDWPLFAILILTLFFVVFQSPHAWNNNWGATNDWFPDGDGQSLANAGFLHRFNEAYIGQQGKAYENLDFYFTNQQIFHGADNIMAAFRANPSFVLKQIVNNYAKLPAYLSLLTVFSSTAVSLPMVNLVKKFLIFSPGSSLFSQILILMAVAILCLFFLYGVFRICKHNSMIIFVIGTLIILLMLPLFTSIKTRYLVPVVPIFILGAIYLGDKSGKFFKKKSKLLAVVALPLFLILFSKIIPVAGIIIQDSSFTNLRLLESPNSSLKATQPQINSLIVNCNGVMAIEHKFVGAFMDIPLKNVYDLWEIPPFGHFSNSSYKGLYPERIDCLLISDSLLFPTVTPTNSYIRYKNYLEPYSRYLQEQGAKTYEIPRYGKVIVYKSPPLIPERTAISPFVCSTDNPLYIRGPVRCPQRD